MNAPTLQLACTALLAFSLGTAGAQAAHPFDDMPGPLAKAAAGDAAAQVKIGEGYAAVTPKPDWTKAAEWYRKAAVQGNIAGEIHLADLYRDGRGVTRDMAQAAAWYRKAADQGNPGAQGTLGLLYSVGMGVPHEDVEAYYWLSLASSVAGPNQARFITNRQSVGEHITTDQQAAVEERVTAWRAAHPIPATKP